MGPQFICKKIRIYNELSTHHKHITKGIFMVTRNKSYAETILLNILLSHINNWRWLYQAMRWRVHRCFLGSMLGHLTRMPCSGLSMGGWTTLPR